MRSSLGSELSAVSSGTERHRNEGTLSSSTRFSARRDAGFAEIFLRQHVGRDLAPGGGNFDAVERKHDRAVGIADFALGGREGDEVIRADARLGVVPFDAHRPSTPFAWPPWPACAASLPNAGPCRASECAQRRPDAAGPNAVPAVSRSDALQTIRRVGLRPFAQP